MGYLGDGSLHSDLPMREIGVKAFLSIITEIIRKLTKLKLEKFILIYVEYLLALTCIIYILQYICQYFYNFNLLRISVYAFN